MAHNVVDAFTMEAYLEFKKLYDKAVKDNVEIFQFQNQDVLVSYAKYLMEVLDEKFKHRNN